MELNGILKSLENKTILVSGATGFLAKIFVEKILRVQPNVKKLYLLLRASDSKSAKQRLNTEVIGKEVFKVLKLKCGTNLDTFILEKMMPVAGDISYENLGINDSTLRDEIWSEVDVIVNFAATTNFEERYDVALGINTYGAKNVVEFAQECKKLEMLVHVSTAYVWGERPGLLLEKAFEMGETLNGKSGLDIEQELQIMEGKLRELREMGATKEEEKTAMKELGLKRARIYGWPNTYVFTKAMGEMLVGHFRGNLPLVIIRPSIVTSTFKEPFPGWIEGIRTIDSLIVGYGKGKLTTFLGSPSSVLDLIPGDIVVNALIVAMVAHANQPSEYVYQVTSSLRNPIISTKLRDLGYRYFSKKPWTNKEGNHVLVNRAVLFTSMASFLNYMSLRYMIPLKGLELMNTASCQSLRETCIDMKSKIKFVMRMVELYRPYIFFQGIFDDLNLERLRLAVRANEPEAKMFYFDSKCIDWEFYFMNIHIPGVVRYLFK